MNKIIRNSFIIIIITLFVYLIYFLTIRPMITGEYMPSKKDCKNAYACQCVKDTCVCSYKRWFIESKLTCKMEELGKKFDK